MVKEEISKYHTFYSVFGCDANTVIPTNDSDAWKQYKKYNWIYNRLQLAQMQNISAAPMPIEPDSYPVILKPIINLYGMGLGIHKINNTEEFNNKWYSNDFWEEYLEGDHISVDILLIDGKIQWHCAFKGYQLENNFGSFRHWESINYQLCPNIMLIISSLEDFTGCINLEVIGGKIIEGHLRMGDITKLPDDNIIKGLISIYQGKKWEFPVLVPKIYLFPIWIYVGTQKDLLDSLDRNIIRKICNDAYSFQIDKGTEANPSDLRRIMMISAKDYDTGMSIVQQLYQYIHSL